MLDFNGGQRWNRTTTAESLDLPAYALKRLLNHKMNHDVTAGYIMRDVERWGSGTLRIAEELEKSGLPKPDFISKPGRFKLIFYKEQLTSRKISELGLSERQIKAIAYTKEHGSITNSEYQAVAQVSKSTATRDLNELKEKNILVSGGTTGRGTVYKIKGALPQIRGHFNQS